MVQSDKSLQVSRELLSDKVADALRYQIITGRMVDGERLVELDVATRMGVSRATLREALTTLEHEGLVITTPGPGTYIKAPTEERVRQLYEVRTVLEVYAVELASQRINSVQIAELEALLQDMTQATRDEAISEFARIDLRIHQLILEIADNEYLSRALEYAHSLSKALIYLNAERFTDWPEVVELHRQLVDAVVSGNKVAAIATVKQHLEHSLGKVLDVIRTKPWQPISDNKPAPDGDRAGSAVFG